MNKFLNVFLKVLTGITAVYISCWVWMATFLMLTVIGATTRSPDKWAAYSFGFLIFLVAFGIVFSVCYVAKLIITKVIPS